jgi:16S rRNA (adenine1518-N6/adenine1519-N6)-dimethyltransferase
LQAIVNTPDLPSLRDVIASHGLSARKSLGQHFLLDMNLTRRIAQSAGDLSHGTVIEIGPGPGGLTRAILESGAAHVVAIERDHRAVAIAQELAQYYPGRLEVIDGDAMKVDIATLGQTPRRIIANLPYNISTPLLIQWLSRIDAFASITVMLQKEVVDRLAAAPGTSDYGRLSVIAQWLCDVEPLFNVDRRAFTPPPAVTSTVVRLTPKASPLPAGSYKALETVTAAAFGQRRKMLRSSLKSLDLGEQELARTGIDLNRRAETLTIAEFCLLSSTLDESRRNRDR